MPKPLLPLLLLSFALTACAGSDERLASIAISPAAEADRWENFNRGVYRFNDRLDRALVSPVPRGYRTVVPTAPRRGIGNFYRLAREPTYAANATLQGKPKGVLKAIGRVLVNSVLGLGLADHATGMGLTREPHDFGQTLAVWGVASGPYLYTPFLGPSTLRDTLGFLVDFAFDPADQLKYRTMTFEQRMVMLGIRGLDMRSGLMDQGEQLLMGAADPYATTRAAWLQLRRYELFDGNPPLVAEDDWEDDWEDTPSPSPAPAAPATPAEEAQP